MTSSRRIVENSDRAITRSVIALALLKNEIGSPGVHDAIIRDLLCHNGCVAVREVRAAGGQQAGALGFRAAEAKAVAHAMARRSASATPGFIAVSIGHQKVGLFRQSSTIRPRWTLPQAGVRIARRVMAC
jgi:hypothetical protein